MNVREVRCPECGATRKVLDNALVIMCEYCGAFMGLDQGVETRIEISRKAMQHLRNPTQASVRYNELSQKLPEAAAGGDRNAWRTMAEELYSLYAVLYPEIIPGGTERASVRKWHREAVVTAELCAFEPDVKEAHEAYSAALMELFTGKKDPVRAAREALERCMEYYRALASHPDCPAGIFGSDLKHHALSTMKASLVGVTGVLGAETVERIKREVFGEKEKKATHACPECGAPLSEGEKVTCPFCGSVLIARAEDLWVSEQLAYYRQSAEHMTNAAPESLVLTALSFVSMALDGDPGFPVERAVTFLREAVGWASADMILGQARRLFQGGHQGFVQKLETALAGWEPSEQPPAAGAPETVQASAGARWTEQLLQSWRTTAEATRFSTTEEEAMTLVSHCLYPFHIGSALTTDHAVDFFRHARQHCSDSELAAAAQMLKQGFAENKQISDFLSRLIKRLR